MNHPHDDQWMSYLYDELNSAERADLKAHLHSCAECQAKIGEWQATQKSLSSWQVSTRRRQREPIAFALPLLKWAVAVVVLLCAGMLIGRFTSASVTSEQLRAQIEPQLRQEFARMLREELSQSATTTLHASGEQTKALLASYAATSETNRAEDNAAILTAINRLAAQRIADYLSLKHDVDTVAVNTDLGFRNTQLELNQLADNTPPPVLSPPVKSQLK